MNVFLKDFMSEGIDFSNVLEDFFNTGLGNIISAASILLFTIVTAKLVRWLLKRRSKKLEKFGSEDATHFQFLYHIAVPFIYLIGILSAIYKIPAMREIAVSLLASAGLLALVAGLASQQAFGNIASGFFITIFKPFRIGDRIIVQNYEGVVEDITLRHTTIRTIENKRVIIPNRTISSEIIVNFHIDDEKICQIIYVSLAYDSDLERAMALISEEVTAHPLFLDVRSRVEIEEGRMPVPVDVVSLDEFGVKLRIRLWTHNPDDGYAMAWDSTRNIKLRFEKEGIRLAYPYRNIYVHNASAGRTEPE